MEEFKVLEKKSTISFTKVSLRTISIMDMEGTFIPMATTIQECGKMENGVDGENQLIRVVRYTKVCGNTVNSLEIEEIDDHKLLLIQQTKMMKKYIN